MKKYKIFFLPLIVIFLGGWISKDDAFKNYPLGAKASNPFRIGDVSVPLPPGDWVIAGRRVYDSNVRGPSFSNNTTMAHIILVDVFEKKLRGTISIITPLEYGTTSSWTKSNDCARDDMLHRGNDELPQIYSHFCWRINHRRFSFDGEAAKWDSIKEMIAGFQSNGIALPGNTLTAGFIMAVGRNYLSVAYDRNPEIDGIARSREVAWSTSDWHKDRIHQFPDKQQYADKMKAWAMGWKEKIKEGFHAK